MRWWPRSRKLERRSGSCGGDHIASGADSGIWSAGPAYEAYVGRWSRPVARELLSELGIRPGARWLDVGCGTGALTQTILELAAPAEVVGVDPSEGFVDHARRTVADARARFQVASAERLPFPDGSFDVVVSGLVLNFVTDPGHALDEAARVVAAGGTVAIYVWDYAHRMELIRHFWDAAVELDAAATELDEGKRFPICNSQPLRVLFEEAGLRDSELRTIDVATPFRDFDDYWTPFLGAQGPAPAYAASLSDERREALRERIRSRLPIQSDGSIKLIARALAVSART